MTVSPTDIPFIDAHIHLWDLSHIRYAWLTAPFADDGPNGSVEPIARDYGVDAYLADIEGWNVVGTVHIDAGADPDQAVDESIWLEGIAAERGLPTGIVAYAPLDDASVEPILAAQAAHPHVRGIRQIVNWHGDGKRTYTSRDMTCDPQWQASYALLAKYGLSFDLQCYPGQMAGLAPLLERHPDIPILINHMGMPVLTDPDGIEQWRVGMKALAAIPHAAVKISGAGFIDRNWTREGIEPFVLETIDLFGTERCLFASDAPTDKLFAPIGRYLDAYHAIVTAFSDAEKRAMFGGNANRLYRLGLTL
jgi:predicted TIM-barrel fold metal-dependent hydrolase